MTTKTLRNFRYLKYLLYVAPGFALWFVLALLPNLQIFRLSLFEWNGISAAKKYVGLDNFHYLLLDPNTKRYIINTVLYIIFLLAIQTAISLGLAIALRRSTAHNHFFRTLFFSPLVLSSIMVGMIWGYMYDPNLGIINKLLSELGLGAYRHNWLGAAALGVFCVVLVHIWHNLGIAITLIMAGLQTIPETLYEAASVEGASPGETFRYVTLPLLMPTLLRVSLLTIVGGALAFDYAFTLGGSLTSSEFDTLSVTMFRSLNGTNVGLPSAIGVLLALLIFVVFIIQYIVTRKVEDAIH